MMIGGMAKQWITAAKALAIVAEHSSPSLARIGLCSRAHADLVATMAKLFTVGDKRREDGPVPVEFWWADGGAALDQDWAAGDFSTWLNRKVECKAFGVLFELEGVLAMIPWERRGGHRLSLSVAGDPAWVTAKQARQHVGGWGGVAGSKAGNVLIDNCRYGFVSARAVLMQRADGGRAGEWSHEECEWDVPTWFWSNFIDLEALEDWDDWHESPHDWERGVFAGQGYSPTGACWVVLSGTHFHIDALQALYPSVRQPTAPSDSSPDPRQTPGGRPPASFWDDLWCSVWGQIYRGDLKPKLQADVEKAMLEWASAHGHEPSHSTIRSRARKLFQALQDEGKNPGAG
jgi:hypothetical protein